MGEDEILAAGFAHNARVCFIAMNIVADVFPDILENRSGAGEVNAGKIGMLENNLSCLRTVGIDKINNAVRHSRLAEYFHQHISGIHRRVRWLPYYHVAHHRTTAGKIACNSGEVERSECIYKSFKRT